MKTSELIDELIAAGCFIKRHGGNHDWWYSPKTMKSASVPRHPSKEIPTGTEKSIRRLLGIKKNG